MYLRYRIKLGIGKSLNIFFMSVSLKLALEWLQSDVDFNLLLGSNDKDQDRNILKDSTGNESDALLGRLIRRLTAVVVTHLPTFWRLAISIFNGKFAKVPLVCLESLFGSRRNMVIFCMCSRENAFSKPSHLTLVFCWIDL